MFPAPAGAGADRGFRGQYGDHRLASADRRHSLYGEIAVDDKTILQVRFTNFAFCDTITETS